MDTMGNNFENGRIITFKPITDGDGEEQTPHLTYHKEGYHLFTANYGFTSDYQDDFLYLLDTMFNAGLEIDEIHQDYTKHFKGFESNGELKKGYWIINQYGKNSEVRKV
ncbi:hypothetical protein SAMN04489761_4316 [Tenacibaculum sp. MAR_2009_124]|uniref:hypothetical protein n=1 Tax=Tenacibaculum sp. MAR_2009_124 TaxID=1250059 RepID=UPI00089C25E4|nr:hypothetical protein [Tenacibaculum sp. MAR_2009_124]SED11354.1 hypothetical protein SAMN04489761_4316 [Tenacibaculum sp. MAR_2009_124]